MRAVDAAAVASDVRAARDALEREPPLPLAFLPCDAPARRGAWLHRIHRERATFAGGEQPPFVRHQGDLGALGNEAAEIDAKRRAVRRAHLVVLPARRRGAARRRRQHGGRRRSRAALSHQRLEFNLALSPEERNAVAPCGGTCIKAVNRGRCYEERQPVELNVGLRRGAEGAVKDVPAKGSCGWKREREREGKREETPRAIHRRVSRGRQAWYRDAHVMQSNHKAQSTTHISPLSKSRCRSTIACPCASCAEY